MAGRKSGWASVAALAVALGLAGGGAARAAGGSAAPVWGVTVGIDKWQYTTVPGSAPVMHASITLFNRSSQPVKIVERGQKFNWHISDGQGHVVWDYARGRMFPMYVRNRTLANGEIVYSLDIPLRAQDGTPLPAGRYILSGALTSDLESGTVGFSVTTGGRSSD